MQRRIRTILKIRSKKYSGKPRREGAPCVACRDTAGLYNDMDQRYMKNFFLNAYIILWHYFIQFKPFTLWQIFFICQLWIGTADDPAIWRIFSPIPAAYCVNISSRSNRLRCDKYSSSVSCGLVRADDPETGRLFLNTENLLHIFFIRFKLWCC